MVTVLRERENDILIKHQEKFQINGHNYIGTNYEWWHDKEKMKQNIHGEEGYIYCSSYSGCTDEEAIEWFEGAK